MTKAQKFRRAKLAVIGCAMCHRIHGPHEPGPVELHHLRGGGWGKGDDATLIPLCFNHHRGSEGIHHVGTKLWERDLGVTQVELLKWTLERVPA
jgi:hypothetical protein